MGKALLIMVLGTGLYLAVTQFGTQDALVGTAERQGEYQEEIIAREIARSGFNVAMSMIRPYGGDLLGAVQVVNGERGDMRGEHQGGEYRVKARLVGGFTIELASTGYFGGRWVNGEYRDGAKHVMTDRYTIPVLNSRSCSVLKVRFLDSQAGYCSAIFLQRYPFGVPLDSPPTPEMLFAASHNDDYNDGMGDNDLTVTKYIDAGTQMNFFIGVDENCSTRPHNPRGYDVLSHVYNPRDYDHLHYALDIDVEELREMEESIWALVEQHPVDNQRWRIGWEDIHNTSWDRPEGTDPRNSLQALKLYGYDLNNDGRGDGWTRPSPTDYRRLRDGQLDLSDQVVEVTLEPVDPAITGGECSVYRIAGNDPTP